MFVGHLWFRNKSSGVRRLTAKDLLASQVSGIAPLLTFDFPFSSIDLKASKYANYAWDPAFVKMLLELNILTFRLPQGPRGKESACHSRRNTRHSFHPWVRKIPWRRKQQPTLVFLPGKIPWTWSHKKLDMTKHANMQMHTYSIS